MEEPGFDQRPATDPDWAIFTDGAPGGETPQQVSDRADRALATAAGFLDSGDVAMVCHGHLSRVLAVRWAGFPITAGAALAMDPAAITVLGIDRAYIRNSEIIAEKLLCI